MRIADRDLTGETLLAAIDAVGPERWRAMAEASRGLGRRGAAARVLEVLREVSRP